MFTRGDLDEYRQLFSEEKYTSERFLTLLNTITDTLAPTDDTVRTKLPYQIFVDKANKWLDQRRRKKMQIIEKYLDDESDVVVK